MQERSDKNKPTIRKENALALLHPMVLGGAATCSEGFVYFFLRVTQAVGLYCSCHAAQASKGNFKKACYETFGTSGHPAQ